MEDNKDLYILSIVSIVAIIGILILVLTSANISGQVPKNIATTPVQIALTSPNNGAVVSLTPTLDWSKTHNAEFIVLYVDNEPGFSSPLIQNLEFKKNEKAYTVPAGILESGKTYYWRVVAYNSAGATNSDTWSFTTQ